MAGQTLMLDALNPPNPSAWVGHLRQLGCGAGAFYAWLNWTNSSYGAAHVQLARGAGLQVLPIVVPGNGRPDINMLLDAVRAYGLFNGPLALDLERGSLPPFDWATAFSSAAKGRGYGPVLEYGTAGTLQGYLGTNSDGWWVANWGAGSGRSSRDPIPQLGQIGSAAWQYAHDLSVGGSQYDISLIDPLYLGAEAMGLTPEEAGKLQDVLNQVRDNRAIMGDLVNLLLNGADSQGRHEWVVNALQFGLDANTPSVFKKLDDLKKEIDALSAGNAPSANLLALVNSLKTSVDRIEAALKSA